MWLVKLIGKALLREYFINWNINLIFRGMMNVVNRYAVGLLWLDYKKHSYLLYTPFQVRVTSIISQRGKCRMCPAGAV